MISIAIIGILTAIIFTNFSQEKDRNALKSAVHQLQTDLQAMQTNAQAGVVTSGYTVGGYGLWLTMSNVDSYKLFVDVQGTTLNLYDSGDPTLTDRRLPANVIILRLSGVSNSFDWANVVYRTPNASAVFSIDHDQISSILTIVLKHTTLNVCYAVTVTANVGTVSKRQLASCI